MIKCYKNSVLSLCAAIVLASCAAPGPDKPVVEVIDRTDRPVSDRQAPIKHSSAVVSLQKQAQTFQRQGQNARAAAMLERAIRIQPKNAEVWYQLARVRFAQKRYQQAEAMALRSSQYLRANRPMLIRNWELILMAREKIGRKKAIELAKKRLQLLRESR